MTANAPDPKPRPDRPGPGRFRRAVPALLLLLAGALPLRGAGEGEPPAPPPPGDEAGVTPAVASTEERLERLAEHVERGNAARQRGRMDEAIDAYRAAREIDPTRYEVRLLLADTLRRAGRSEARSEYEAAVRLDAARPEGYVGLALLRRASFDYGGARGVIERGIESVGTGGRAELLVHLAEILRREGRFDQAAAIFAQEARSAGATAPAHAGLARVAEERGDLETAVQSWSRYLDLVPGDAAAEHRRDEVRELRAAIGALREASGRGPAAPVHAELGRLLALSGDVFGAAVAYRAAIEIDPRHLEARRGLAVALRAAGDPRGAAAAFRRVLELRPDDGLSLYHLADLARAADDDAAQEAAWIALVEARPQDGFAARAYVEFIEREGPEALHRSVERLDGGDTAPASRLRLRALLLASAQRWPETATALHRALRDDPSDPRTLEVAGEILHLNGALLQALVELARREMAAVTAGDGPGAARLIGLMSRLNTLAGRRPEALALAQRAAAADPRSAPARSLLAEATLSAARDLPRALEEMDRAVELAPARLVGHVDLALALVRSGRPEEAAAAARAGLEQVPGAPELLSILGAALADQEDLEGAARAYAEALAADPADNFGLSRAQYPLMLAALGRQIEARHALAGDLPILPEILYREAWAFARDASRDRTYNGQDWMAWRDRYRGRLTSAPAAYRAIATMLASLDDPYTRLRDPEETTAVYLTRHGPRVAVDPLGRNRPHSRTVLAGEIPGGLGYIRLSNLTDPNVVAEVRRALERMREKEGLVLDLRGNPGGLTRAADAIGDMLVGPGKEDGVDVGPEGATRRVTGGEGAVARGPITVIVDSQTGSAAERLARTLAGAGRATLVGETTHGKGIFQNARILPGGVTVLVSTGEMLDPEGRPIEGRGLAPRRRSRADGPAAPADPPIEDAPPVPADPPPPAAADPPPASSAGPPPEDEGLPPEAPDAR